MSLTACGGGEETGGTSFDGDASLGILEPGVTVADEPADVAAATFRAGEDGEPLVVRDLVRTDAAGFAEVRWVAGALARLDVDTVLEVTALDLETGQPTVSTRLEVGRVWNRLESGAADYEVTTDVGTAAVRGTGFLVSCVPLCTFGVAEGVLSLVTTLGVEIELQPGEQITVDADGQPGTIEPFDIDDAWVQENLQRDEDLGFPGVTGTFDPDGGDRPQLATARLDGVYQYDFTMEDSSREDLIGQQVQRNWGFEPDCEEGPCSGTYAVADGEDERFVWTGTGYAATWVDRPAGECPDGSSRWLEDLAITFTPTAFEEVDGRVVVTAADAVWISTLTPTDEAVASGCDTDPPVDQRLVGTGTRTGN